MHILEAELMFGLEYKLILREMGEGGLVRYGGGGGNKGLRLS